MQTISEKYPENSGHSIRINKHLIQMCNSTGLPLSNIIESCLVNFCKMSDENRIKFLVENNIEKVDSSCLIEPKFNYAERATYIAKQNLGNKSTGKTSMKFVIAVGLALLVALFVSEGKEV